MKIDKNTIKNACLIELVDYVISEMPLLLSCNDSLYAYNGKFYELLDNNILGRYIHDFYLDHYPKGWSPNKANNIIEGIKYSKKVKLVDELDNYENLINLSNGIYNFDNKELSKHDPKYCFTTCVDVDYDPSIVEAPYFADILMGIFKNPDGSFDKSTIENILKLGGYLMYPKNKINKMFIFHGGGSNGKSIIMEHVYKMYFDKNFISALSLNALSNEESFSRKKLISSRVNFATEQKAGSIESEELKKIVSGETVNIQRKHLDDIIINPVTKIIIACNKLPKFKDVTNGTDRRLFMFNFKNEFESDVKKYEEYDKPELRRIFLAKNEDEVVENLKKEKTAIFNIFLKALDRLRKDNWKFSTTENSEELFQEYKEQSDYLGTWLKDEYELGDSETRKEEYEYSVKDVLNHYKEWWEYNFSDRKFDTSTKYVGKRICDVFRIKGAKINVYDGTMRTTRQMYNLKLKEPVWEDTTTPQPQEEIDPIQGKMSL